MVKYFDAWPQLYCSLSFVLQQATNVKCQHALASKVCAAGEHFRYIGAFEVICSFHPWSLVLRLEGSRDRLVDINCTLHICFVGLLKGLNQLCLVTAIEIRFLSEMASPTRFYLLLLFLTLTVSGSARNISCSSNITFSTNPVPLYDLINTYFPSNPTLPAHSAEDQAAIRNTLSLYPLALDGKNFADFHRVFTQDAVANYSAPIGVLNGVDVIAAALSTVLQNVTTQHAYGTQVVSVGEGGCIAKTVTYYKADHFGTGAYVGEVSLLCSALDLLLHSSTVYLLEVERGTAAVNIKGVDLADKKRSRSKSSECIQETTVSN